jgi:hypothetical protein
MLLVIVSICLVIIMEKNTLAVDKRRNFVAFRL